MGLFEKAGRRFEQFKKTAESAAEEEADYACTACESHLYAAAERCPECGAEGSVVPLAEEEATADAAPESTAEESVTEAAADPERDDEGS